VTLTAWQKAGLLQPSVTKPILATIEKGLVIRKLGQLQDADRQPLENALRLFLG
jgi:mRNA interferase MazF